MQVDVTLDILKQMLIAKPDSAFIKSLHEQYCNRGGLSKKQLEGLYAKAVGVENIAPSKLATLQAIINRKPTRYKSEAVKTIAQPVKDESAGELMKRILEKFPAHKRILFLQSKYEHNDPLSGLELEEVKKIGKVLGL